MITGGMRSEAGTDRIVPIHPLIRDLIEERIVDAKSLRIEYLFNNADSQQGIYMTYDNIECGSTRS